MAEIKRAHLTLTSFPLSNMSGIRLLISRPQTDPLPQSILEPYRYLELIPSNNKNVRLTFLRAFNEIFYHIKDELVLADIDEVISIFHNASLLIDDIEDGSDFRRGLPTAHRRFGVPLTINSGNLMYFVALEKAMKIGEGAREASQKEGGAASVDGARAVAVSRILTDEMLFLHRGQGLDIYWRDHKESLVDPPSVEEYLSMVMNKTGGLFRLSVRLLECFAPAKAPPCVPLANLLGIVYQIRDDYLNLVDTNYLHMKGVIGEDLIEGKLSLPILHALRYEVETGADCASLPVHSVLLPQSRQWLKDDQRVVARTIDYMRKTGSLQYTKVLLTEYHALAREMIQEHGPDCTLLRVVDQLCNVPEP